MQSGSLRRVKLHVLPAGPIQTNAYLLTSAERGEAILIDAPGDVWADVAPILEAEKCKLTELWLTHGHWDHTQGGAEVVRATGAKVRGHKGDQTLYETPKVMSAFLAPGLKLEPIIVDHWVAQGDSFTALGTEIEVRHVPGHCPGNVLFYFKAGGVAFVGDALFNGSIGRTDLPMGNHEQLLAAIKAQIYTLPAETTTVGQEMASNPYVRGS